MSKATEAPRPPARSGFCNPSFRLDTEQGRASHGRCHKANCPCTCHTEPEPDLEPGVITADAYDALNYRTVFAPGVYPTFVRAAQITAARGDYSWWRTGDRLVLLRNPEPPPEWSIGPFSIVQDPSIPKDEVRLVHPDGSLAAKVLVTP